MILTKAIAVPAALAVQAKTNYYYYYLEVVTKKGDEVKTEGNIFLESDFSKFNKEEFVDSLLG